MEPVNPLLTLYDELEAKIGKNTLENSPAADIAKKVLLYQEVSSGKVLLHVQKKPFGWRIFQAICRFFKIHPEPYRFKSIFETAEKQFEALSPSSQDRKKLEKIEQIINCLAEHVAKHQPEFATRRISWTPPAPPEREEAPENVVIPVAPPRSRPLPTPTARPVKLKKDLVFDALKHSDTRWKRGEPNFSELKKLLQTEEFAPIPIQKVLDKISAIKNKKKPSTKDLEALETCMQAIQELPLFDTIQHTLTSLHFKALQALQNTTFTCPAINDALNTLRPDHSAYILYETIEQVKTVQNRIKAANAALEQLPLDLSTFIIAPIHIDKITSLDTLQTRLEEINSACQLVDNLKGQHEQFMAISQMAKQLQNNVPFTDFCTAHFPLASPLITEIATCTFLKDPHQSIAGMPFSDKESLTSWLAENKAVLDCYQKALNNLSTLANAITKPLDLKPSSKPGETYLKTLTDSQNKLKTHQELLQRYQLDVYTDLIATFASTTAKLLEKGSALTHAHSNEQRTLRSATNNANPKPATLAAFAELQKLETRLTDTLKDAQIPAKKMVILQQSLLARPIRFSSQSGSKIESAQKKLMTALGLQFDVKETATVDSHFFSQMSKKIAQKTEPEPDDTDQDWS